MKVSTAAESYSEHADELEMTMYQPTVCHHNDERTGPSSSLHFPAFREASSASSPVVRPQSRPVLVPCPRPCSLPQPPQPWGLSSSTHWMGVQYITNSIHFFFSPIHTPLWSATSTSHGSLSRPDLWVDGRTERETWRTSLVVLSLRYTSIWDTDRRRLSFCSVCLPCLGFNQQQ